MMCSSMIGKVACILVIVGAINWGLVGLFGLDVVALLLGGIPMAAKAVYILVGAAGVYKLVMCFKGCS